MSFSETILLPMNGPVPDNVRSYKRVNNIPQGTRIKVYSNKSTDAPFYIQIVDDFEEFSNGKGFICYLYNGSAANTNLHIIAEVTTVNGNIETNSKVPEINSKAPEIDFSKIDAAENKLIQAIRDATASFKQSITQTRSGGRRRRTFRKK